MKKRRGVFVGLTALAATAINLIQCSNPVDDPPLQWRSAVEVPVSNERFLIGEQLDDLFTFEDLDILNVLQRYSNDPTKLVSDTIRGDTVVFSVLKDTSSDFESHEKAFDDKEFHVKIGTIPISNAPVVRDTIPLPATAQSFSVPVRVALDKVYEVRFTDTATNILRVQLTNAGPVAVTGVSFGIAGVDTVPVGTIAAGAKATASFSVAGKRLTDSTTLYVAGTVTAAAGQALGVEFSLNGLTADYLTVDDHLIDFKREFTNPYELTDTVDIDYIDIGDGFFQYKILNYTDFDLFVQGVHQHMWTRSFTERKGITRFEDLDTLSAADSALGFFGTITSGKLAAYAHAEQTFGMQNLSSARLFPEWNDSLKKSVTKVTYTITPGTPSGRKVTIAAQDSLLFTISTIGFKFREFLGTLTESYERESDTQMVPITLPWNNSSKDSLRNKFILSKVWGDVLVRTEMPERSFLDTMLIDFIAFAPESAAIQDSLLTAFRNVARDSTYFRSINVTRVANVYSDSIAIAMRVHVPKGTRMRVVNDLGDVHDPDFDKYIGRMIIHVNTSYRLNAKLDWRVQSPVNMDLGSSRFKLAEAFRFFRKLEDRKATFDMWLRNYSNLNLSLYALVAPDALMDTLDSLTMNEMYRYLTNSTSAMSAGFVNLLGDSGILVPKRDTTSEYHNTVVLNDQQLERLFSADSLNFRWWVQFKQQDRDALNDTDFVDLKSRFGLQGINTTDSLLIWE